MYQGGAAQNSKRNALSSSRSSQLAIVCKGRTCTLHCAHLRAVHFYRGAPAPAHILHFADARHAEWIAANETREFSLSVTTALLLRRFYGVNGVDSWLPEGPQVAARIGSLLDYAASR